MDKRSKVLSSLALAGSLLALTSGTAQAMVWWDEPFLGLAPVNTSCSTVDGVNTCVNGSNSNPSQAVFMAPILGDGFIYATSGMTMTAGSTYDVTRTVNYLDGFGFINFSPLFWDGGDWVAVTQSGFNDIAEPGVCAGNGFGPGCLGNWAYTETWLGLTGPDATQTLSSTRAFCVETQAGACAAENAVPEPATLALLGLGLAGLGFGRRKRA